MNDQSSTWRQATLPGFAAVTGSPASADGPRHYGLQPGPTQSPSGPAAPLASRSAPPESALDATTPATSAPLLSIWSGLPAPLCCLANRSQARTCSDTLQRRANEIAAARLHGRGATIYSYASKQQVTPHGRSIFRLRARAHPTFGNGASSPPSICDLPLTGWPTATTRDWKDGGNPDANVPLNALLGRVAWLSGWPTPMAGTPAQNGNNPAGNTDSSRKTVELAGWPTSSTADVNLSRVSDPQEYSLRKLDRPHKDVNLALYAQAYAADSPARLTASGEMLTGCSAGMASGGQLNPAFSLWLMGYQAAWVSCGERAMQSCRRQRRKPSPSPETP